MCNKLFNEDKAKLSLLKLGRVLRLMKIVCKIILQTKTETQISNSLNVEKDMKEFKKVKKSEYT